MDDFKVMMAKMHGGKVMGRHPVSLIVLENPTIAAGVTEAVMREKVTARRAA